MERVGANPGEPVAGGNHWIGRGEMTEEFVDLVWSPIEADDVTYRIYRVLSIGTDLAAVDLAAADLVHEGRDGATAYRDTAVEPNVFYSYLLVPEVAGTILERRWTNALTTTDTTPPTQVQITEANRTDDGVLICWTPSSDNVEFASYSVSLMLDDGELRYLGGGADIEQTCFVDNAPLATNATYVVQAVDFHDNRSERAMTTVAAR